MKVSNAIRGVGVALGMLIAAASAMAYNPDPPRDPRSVGITPTRVWTEGDEVIRVDRWPDGQPRRCVRAARLDTPAGGGPSRIEFGVERASPDAPDVTMFFRIQYLDGPNGKPLAVRNPVFMMERFGPTADWRLEALPGGWFRRSKSAARSDIDERLQFTNETKVPGNEVVSTFPDGSHRVHHTRGGVSPWHFEMFWNCVCALSVGLPKETIQGFPCR